MRTSVHIPDDVLADFDATWRAEGLDSRSRAVREAIGEYVERHVRLEAVEGEVAAVVAYDYDHGEVGDLYAVQHEYGDVVTATSHVHHGEWCLETLSCAGPAERVRGLVYALRDFDAVSRVKVLLLAGS
jgi:CopG family nickel-responsive transcriptional regulator